MQNADIILIIFQLVILFFSAVVHEVAHGYAALFQGDATAKYEKRLTLNPLRHIDPFGSVILPILLYISSVSIPGAPIPIFGWAKPVPFNPYNLRSRKWGEAIVAIAGPAVNVVIAIVFGLVLRFGGSALPDPAVVVLKMIVVINIMLALFNIVPIPPLDGSKVLFAFFPAKAARVLHFLEKFSILFVLIFILFFWQDISPLITTIFHLITGMTY